MIIQKSKFSGEVEDAAEPGSISYERTSDRRLGKPSASGKSGFGSSRSAWGSSKKAKDDGFVSEITRTSDNKKRFKKKAFSGAKPETHQAGAGEVSRSSEQRRAAQYGATRTKPNHTSKAYAIYLLSKRDYTAKMLRERIVRRGYSEEEANEAMAFVISNKYQSDERFASFKASDVERRGGNLKVLMTLRQKGIDEDLAKAQIANLGPEEDRAVTFAEKYRARVEREGLTDKMRMKIYRSLASRGFSPSSVAAALKSLAPGYKDEHFDPYNPD
jgi:regulatory protein